MKHTLLDLLCGIGGILVVVSVHIFFVLSTSLYLIIPFTVGIVLLGVSTSYRIHDYAKFY